MMKNNSFHKTVQVTCPAKTNITLHVGEKHEEWNNRHELDTIYCGIGVCDIVTISEKDANSDFSLELTGSHLGNLASSNVDMRNNHAVAALYAMAKASNHKPNVRIQIEKHIPVAAGLGGGSADAAGTILALNELWNLHWDITHLQEIAATLGADMPFCLTGGYAHGTGYGEKIEEISYDSVQAQELREQGYYGLALVGAYHTELSTADIYHQFDKFGSNSHNTNDLQEAAIMHNPRSGKAIELAKEMGASQAFISGSGPSVIAFARTQQELSNIQHAWTQEQAVDRIIAATTPMKPTIRLI
ncbi:MAG: 4-(cytidine 5'-diphospho)-2-C-methyl-D-erythritol kinase [Bifidobacteriaceae bacterium]|nr:4-(cytidine 5'-diphospho)-2-C-methyl-D-erythritol kinase [Bifidobacteriaceae bacterium]